MWHLLIPCFLRPCRSRRSWTPGTRICPVSWAMPAARGAAAAAAPGEAAPPLAARRTSAWRSSAWKDTQRGRWPWTTWRTKWCSRVRTCTSTSWRSRLQVKFAHPCQNIKTGRQNEKRRKEEYRKDRNEGQRLPVLCREVRFCVVRCRLRSAFVFFIAFQGALAFPL